MYTHFKIVKEYKDKKTVLARDQIIAIFTIMTDVHNNYPLKDLNSFGLDSHATRFARPGDLESLSSLLERESNHQQPLLVLGEGSNILFKDIRVHQVGFPRITHQELIPIGTVLLPKIDLEVESRTARNSKI